MKLALSYFEPVPCLVVHSQLFSPYENRSAFVETLRAMNRGFIPSPPALSIIFSPR